MRLDKVRSEDWILAGLALLLVICLVFLPWFTISVGALSVSFSATSAPDGWLGGFALVAVLAVLGDLVVERLAPRSELPTIGASRAMTRLVLAGIAAGFILLKFLLHIHFSLFGWGFYATIVVTAALVIFAAVLRSTSSSARPPDE